MMKGKFLKTSNRSRIHLQQIKKDQFHRNKVTWCLKRKDTDQVRRKQQLLALDMVRLLKQEH